MNPEYPVGFNLNDDHFVAPATFNYLMHRHRDNLSKGRFLELGCATAQLTEMLLEEGFEGRGMDVNPLSEADFVDRGVIEDMPYEDDSFSFVLSCCVLDSGVFPAQEGRYPKIMQEIYRVLKPGGMYLAGER